MLFSLRITTLSFMLIMLAGCFNQSLKVTYLSDPEGATIYEGNKRVGYTPETLVYDLTDNDVERGYITIQGKQARWPSGATIEIDAQTINLAEGLNREYIFMRPSDAPGHEIDANFAIEMIRTKLLKQQLALQRQELQRQIAADERQQRYEEEKLELQKKQLEIQRDLKLTKK